MLSADTGYSLTQPYGNEYGFQTVIVGANPGAGQNFVQTVDSRWVWRLVSCVFTLTTDANVANRYVTVEYAQDAAAPYCVNAPAVTFTASGTARYAGKINQTVGEWNTGTDALFSLAPVFIWGGNTITVRVGNIQVGDTLTLLRFVFERYPTDPYTVPGDLPVA